MSDRDAIKEGLSNMNRKWNLSCFSIAEAVPDDRSFEPRTRNEVVGDVSFEEVRWADLQEPNKQLCVRRFAEAHCLKALQFQVIQPGCDSTRIHEHFPSRMHEMRQCCETLPDTICSCHSPPCRAEPSHYYLSFVAVSHLVDAIATVLQMSEANLSVQALAQRSVAPSNGGQPVPEPPSPYSNPAQPNSSSIPAFGPHSATAVGATPGAGPFGMTSTPQQPFVMLTPPPAQPQPSQAGRIQFGQKAVQAIPNPFGSSNDQRQANAFQPGAAQQNPFGQGGNQPGHLQFGSKAGQAAAAPFGPDSHRQSAAPLPFGSQSKPVKPFNSTEDPFGRQKPGQSGQAQQQAAPTSTPFAQAQQPAASGPNLNPFAQNHQQQQRQMPATPAAPAAPGPFGGLQAHGTGADFQTPAVQQRPAFAGGVAVSLQSPSPGKQQPPVMECSNYLQHSAALDFVAT